MSKIAVYKMCISLLSGILFGSGMIISGMVDPMKVIGFLNLAGEWDPSLVFVMGGALCVFTPIYHFFIKNKKESINGEAFHWVKKTNIDKNLITGAVIFGIGWGLAGFCPGPVISSLAGGSPVIILFVSSMLFGMFIANQYLSGRFPLPFIGDAKNCR